MYRATATVSLNLRVPPELRDWLEKEARQRGESVTRVVVQLLDDHRAETISRLLSEPSPTP